MTLSWLYHVFPDDVTYGISYIGYLSSKSRELTETMNYRRKRTDNRSDDGLDSMLKFRLDCEGTNFSLFKRGNGRSILGFKT